MKDKQQFELAELAKSFAELRGILSEGVGDKYRLLSLAVMIRDIYSGIERVIRYRLAEVGVDVKDGSDWHVRLLGLAFENAVISQDDYKPLRLTLGFRHRFNNGYSHNLELEKLVPIAEFLLDFEGHFVKG